MKAYLCVLCCIWSLFIFSQTEQFTIHNIAMNNDKPHFGLSITSDYHILVTSYLLNKNGKIKTYLGNGIYTIYDGIKSENGNIDTIEP